MLCDHRLESLRASLRAGMTERPLRHDDRPGSADAIDERLRDGGAHEDIVRSEKRMDRDLVEWRDQGIDVDDRNTGADHPIDGIDQGANLNGLNGDEVPVAGCHFSTAALCSEADRPPSNHVTSTLKSLPQNSAACLPCAHHVT